MKQTALDWFIEQLLSEEGIDFIPTSFIIQARQMEKEQIVSAFNNGEFFASDYYHPNNSSVDGSENYYNETYGK